MASNLNKSNPDQKYEASIIPLGEVENLIFEVRGQRVMLDSDLAELYGVETKQLTRAVRRNIDRFPEDFMFQLRETEYDILRSQIGTSNDGRGGRRYSPLVFTEQGVAMLSGVLRSERAIKINILIMRAFVELRKNLISQERLEHAFRELAMIVSTHGHTLEGLAAKIHELQQQGRLEEKPLDVGFKQSKDDD